MHFDSTISVGNLLTIILVVVSAFRLWTKIELCLQKLDMQLAKHEDWIKGHEIFSQKQEVLMSEMSKAMEGRYVRGDVLNAITTAFDRRLTSLEHAEDLRNE